MGKNTVLSDKPLFLEALSAESWFRYGQKLLECTYLQPLQQTNNGHCLKKRVKVKVKNGYIEREIHGAMHASRVAWSTTLLHQLCLRNFPDQVEPYLNRLTDFCRLEPQQLLILIRYVGLGHDAARKGEGYDHWEKESGEEIADFLHDLGLSNDFADIFSKLAFLKDKPEELKEFLSKKEMDESLIEAFQYLRLLIALADCYDIIRCCSQFNFSYIENMLKVVFPDYRSDIEGPIFFDYAKALYELIKQQQDLYFPTELHGPNEEVYKLETGEADYSVAEKVKLEHAENAILAMQQSMEAHSYFSDLFADMPSFEIDSKLVEPAFVPFIHGTNSMALALMTETDFKLMSPLDMIEQYQRAPLCGELTRGGFDSIYATGKSCFARLNNQHHSNEYSLEKVLSDYATVTTCITKEKLLDDLKRACYLAPSIHFSNLNLINIYLTRLNQLGVDLSRIEEVKSLKSNFHKTLDIFYLYMLMGTHIKTIDNDLKEKPDKEQSAFEDKVWESLSLEKVLKRLPLADGLTIREVYENPTEENCQKIIDLLSLPKQIHASPLFEYVETASSEGKIGKRLKKQDFRYLAKNESMWQLKIVLSNTIIGHASMSNFIHLQSKLKSHIHQLSARFSCTEAIIEHPASPFILDDEDKDLVDHPFPLILLYDKPENIQLFSFMSQEYRAQAPLILGKDIQYIATDEKNKERLVQYVKRHNLAIEVITFEQLKLIKSSYLKENVITASQVLEGISAEIIEPSCITAEKSSSSEHASYHIEGEKLPTASEIPVSPVTEEEILPPPLSSVATPETSSDYSRRFRLFSGTEQSPSNDQSNRKSWLAPTIAIGTASCAILGVTILCAISVITNPIAAVLLIAGLLTIMATATSYGIYQASSSRPNAA